MEGDEAPRRPAPLHCEPGARARGSPAENVRAVPVTLFVLGGLGLGRNVAWRAQRFF